jgi:aminoglycoside phosphotransferase (APT) family kinase protein
MKVRFRVKWGGTNFESLKRDPSEMPSVWLDLGRDLAKLHEGSVDLGPPDWVGRYNLGDPLPRIKASAREGRISSSEAHWFQEWLRRLESMVRRANFGRKRFAHADVQMSNVMTAESGDYSALIDWGCALMWEDVTVDFVSMPLSAATLLLQGHHEIAKLDEDDTAEARIVWRRIWEKFIDPPTGKTLSWYWQPSGRGADLRTFFTNPPNERWRAVGGSLRVI